MLIEDGNGHSEVAAAFLLLEESKASITCVANIFKENPEWKSVRVIMADKDMTEREMILLPVSLLLLF